jgi:hypothetical protein
VIVLTLSPGRPGRLRRTISPWKPRASSSRPSSASG